MAFRPKNVHSHVALVSGGIGYEVCHKFHQKGASVALGSRSNVHGVEALNKILNREGFAHHHSHHPKDTLIALTLDVTVPSTINKCVSDAVKHFGRIDYLVNNAGVFPLNWNQQSYDEAMETNYWGAVRLTEACLPHMKKHNFGRIVMVSSANGAWSKLSKHYRQIFEKHNSHWRNANDIYNGFHEQDHEMAKVPGGTHRLSKAMLNSYTQVLAKQLSEQGFDNILVNAVDPGWVRTKMGGPNAPTPVSDAADVVVQAAVGFDDPHTGHPIAKLTGCFLNKSGRISFE